MSESQHQTAFAYRPDLDGLRAVAVLVVILFHAGFGFSGGFIGVDVFFVLSGFLITKIILAQQAGKRFSLVEFWKRRLRRIVPAALVVVSATLVVGWFVLLPKELEDLAESAIAYQLMLANVFFWKEVDYFAGPADLMPLLHTWSLAVEEQFYLFFPLLLALGSRIGRRTVFWVLCGLAIASLIFSCVAVEWSAETAYFLLPSRAWEMLAGALFAFRPAADPERRSGLVHCGGWLGMAVLIGTAWVYTSRTPFPGLFAIPVAVGTLLVIRAGEDSRALLARLLSLRPVVFTGRISYSLYLWHWPILAFLRYRIGPELPLEVRLLAVAVTVVLSIASFVFIETPLRKGTWIPSPKRFLVAVSTAGVVLVCASAGVLIGDGVPLRFGARVAAMTEGIKIPLQYATAQNDAVTKDALPALGKPREAGEPLDFVVWGDSHAIVLGDLLTELATEAELKGVLAAKGGTIPLLDVWQSGSKDPVIDWNRKLIDYVDRHEVRNVLLIARWALYVEGPLHENLDPLVTDGAVTKPTPESARLAFRRGVSQTIDALEERGVRVWVMKQVPVQMEHPVRRAVRHATYPESTSGHGVHVATHRKRQTFTNRVLDEFGDRVTLLDPAEHCFDRAGFSRIADERTVFYYDYDHLSPRGGKTLLRPLLKPVFETIRQRKQSGVDRERIAESEIDRLPAY